MSRTGAVFTIVIILVLAAGGYWYWAMKTGAMMSPADMMGMNGSNQGPTGGADSGQVPQQSSVIGSNLALGTDKDSTLGTYLVGYTGMTVYENAEDTSATSTCYGACANIWSPYLIGTSDNIHQLEAGVNGTVGTLVRTDGTLQLTYNGHPLYFYSSDAQQGDVRGQGVAGVWSVAKP